MLAAQVQGPGSPVIILVCRRCVSSSDTVREIKYQTLHLTGVAALFLASPCVGLRCFSRT